VLDLVRIQVLQLDLVVVQQSSEKWVGRNHESTLVEGRKGHDIAGGAIASSRLGTSHSAASVVLWRRPRLMRPSMHAWVMSERYHDSMGKQGQGNEDFTDGERARARNSSTCGGEAERTRLRLGISKARGKIPVIGGGEARSEPPASIDVPRHPASSGVMHTLPPSASSKGASDDGSP
jgi:hypothetical protein